MSYNFSSAISLSCLFSLHFAATTFKIYIEAGFSNFCNFFYQYVQKLAQTSHAQKENSVYIMERLVKLNVVSD